MYYAKPMDARVHVNGHSVERSERGDERSEGLAWYIQLALINQRIYPRRLFEGGFGGSDGGEGAEVGPAEVGGDGVDEGGAFHDGVVDGDFVAEGEEFAEHFLLFGGVEVGLEPVDLTGDLRGVGFELAEHGGDGEYEDAGVPEVVAVGEV